jgi:hypothetical protein
LPRGHFWHSARARTGVKVVFILCIAMSPSNLAPLRGWSSEHMSHQAAEFLLQAQRAKLQATTCSEELRSVLLAIGDAYELLAHVEESLEDETPFTRRL